MEENEKLVLTPFEKNTNIWIPLWRVVELSNFVYARELDEHERASWGHVSHGGLPDETRAASQILKHCINGKILHYERRPGVTDDELEQRETTTVAAEGPTT